ncbi:MAG: hypothetical protein MAG794_00284 [Gammaproteobacteria bacterium]|nr:hypothetical protein [Gammaproteobacteria bacterium]
MAQRLSWSGYFLRLLFALVLVFATYNPEGFSFFHWVWNQAVDASNEILALMALVGIVIVIGWVIFIRATYRSLGAFGTTLAIAFFAALIWVVMTLLPIPKDNIKLVTYLVLFGLSGVLSAGLSWSHVRRRLSGQFDVDETDM